MDRIPVIISRLDHAESDIVRIEKKVDDSLSRIEKRLDESINWHKTLLVGLILTLIGVIINLLKR